MSNNDQEKMKKGLLDGFGANVLLLGIVSLLNDASSEMIAPILPLFIASLGGAGIATGLLGGLRDSISSVLTIFFGYLSDKLGKRKVFIFSGYFSSAIFKFLLSLSNVWHSVVVFASLERIGKAVRNAPRDALLSDSMKHNKGKGFGIHRALDRSGAIIGSLSVLVMLWYFGLSFKAIILISSAVALVSLIPLYFVKERKIAPQNASLALNFKKLPSKLKLFIVVSSVFALANFSYFFLILKAKEVIPETIFPRSAEIIPIALYILFNVFYTGFSIPLGMLSDRIGREKVLIFGYLMFAAVSIGFIFMSSIPALVLLFAMYGIFNAAVDANQTAFAVDLSPKKIKATALGTFYTTTGLVALPASLIAGFLWDKVTPTATFVYGAVVALAAAAMFIMLFNHSRAKKAESIQKQDL